MADPNRKRYSGESYTKQWVFEGVQFNKA